MLFFSKFCYQKDTSKITQDAWYSEPFWISNNNTGLRSLLQRNLVFKMHLAFVAVYGVNNEENNTLE